MLISLIVPCYNEQEALPIFYEESTKVLAGMDCEYEFLFVNDGCLHGVDKHFTVETMFSILDTQLKQFKISTTDNLLFKREVHDRVEEKASCPFIP